jgi:hypothetical protein
VGYFSKLDAVNVDFSHAAIDLDSIGALTGKVVTDAGTTPSQTATLQVTAGSMPYGVFEAQGTLIDHTTGDAAADVHIKIMKMKINKLDVEAKIDDVGTVSFSAKAIPDASDVIFELTFNETETAIA